MSVTRREIDMSDAVNDRDRTRRISKVRTDWRDRRRATFESFTQACKLRNARYFTKMAKRIAKIWEVR